MDSTLTVEEVKRRLTAAGYVNVYDWYDSPEFENYEHTHGCDVMVCVVQGSMDLKLPDRHVLLAPGNAELIPMGIAHATVAGTDGCQYVLGEKHQP